MQALALSLVVMTALGSAQASVPKIVSGPSTAAEATSVPAPIAQVTVYSDRARIRRRGTVPTGRVGPRSVRLPDLPGGVLLETLRVTAKGAKVLRVEATPVQRNRRSIKQVEGLLDRVGVLVDERALLMARSNILRWEGGVLDAVHPAALPPEDKRSKGQRKVSLAGWAQVLDFLDARRLAGEADEAQLAAQIAEIDGRLTLLRETLAGFDSRAFSAQRLQVLVLLDAKTAQPTLELEYFMTGASWRPTYTVELSGKGRSLTIRSAALVNQATGEDWESVRLALSTAIPGQSIELPELLTWTLGEKRKFTPRPQPRTQQQTPVLPRPTAQPTVGDRLRQTELAQMQTRMRSALAGGKGSLGRSALTGSLGGEQMHGKREMNREVDRRISDLRRRRARPQSAPPSPPSRPSPQRAMASAPMPSAPMEMEDEAAEGMIFGTRRDSVSGLRRTRLDLFEPAPRRRPAMPNWMPAAAAGGLDYVYEAATRVSVPASPELHHVPLTSKTYPIDAYYEATPALKKTAFLRAKVRNGSKKPLLAGPVDIFVGADFIGQGRLETTGSGGEIEFPLGADEDIRFERRVLPSTETEGVFSKEDVTKYRVQIDVANYKRRRVKVRVTDLVPKSDHQHIEIKTGKMKPAPIEGPDADGLLVFEVDLKPGAKTTIEFEYTIRRPADWQLRQR